MTAGKPDVSKHTPLCENLQLEDMFRLMEAFGAHLGEVFDMSLVLFEKGSQRPRCSCSSHIKVAASSFGGNVSEGVRKFGHFVLSPLLSFWGALADEESLYLLDVRNAGMLRFAQHDSRR
jgi:hypothetical protein